MPKIKITDIDNTQGIVPSAISNTVYVPVIAGASFEAEREVTVGEERKVVVVTFTLKNPAGIKEGSHFVMTSLEFNALMETTAVYKGSYIEEGQTISVPDEEAPLYKGLGIEFARQLVNRGMYVVVGDVIGTQTQAKWSARWAALENRGLFDIKFICAGDFGGKEDSEIDISGMKAVAEKRGDCIAIIDHPLAQSQTSKDAGESYSTFVQKWCAANGSSSYAAAFSPWCGLNWFEEGHTMIPPSMAYLLTYAVSIKSNPTWYAAAGSFRGSVPGLVEIDQHYTETDIDVLQCRAVELDGDGDNVGIAVNPICNIDPFTLIIWGNRTLLNNGGELKATSFLNVRNLVCDLKKTMFKAARKYTFEQNSLQLWLNMCANITPLLDKAKSGNGIRGYKLVQEETTAKARLKAKVIIVPIEAVEDFELSVALENSIPETEENA